MKHVLILGASGNIGTQVTNLLANEADVTLTLFVRNARRLKNKPANSMVVEGDVLDYEQLKQAITGQDIVVAGLSGDLESMARNIVKAMDERGQTTKAPGGRGPASRTGKTLIFISSIEIYDTPLKPVLKPYRRAADVIEASDLDYTILRPAWFTSVDEVDYETTRKGEPERGSVISQKSLATLITKIIESPESYARESLGVNKPA